MTEEQLRRKKERRRKRRIRKVLSWSIVVIMLTAIIFLTTAVIRLISGLFEKDAKGEIVLPVETTVQLDTLQEQTEETTVAEAATTEVSTAETTLEEITTDSSAPSGGISGEQLNAADFDGYSTEKVPYGFGAEVDEDNRPDGCTWYANKFSNYTALFIMPKSNNIYLTFDEGYEYGFSGEILDTLKEKM